MTGTFTEHAPAKINLFLHVLGRGDDGLHILDSLVVFADAGDTVELTPGAGFSLDISGPFADVLNGEADNLVARAAHLLAQCIPGARLGHFHLTKTLPVASGMGGGSADAAAALRLLQRTTPALDEKTMRHCATMLGSDVAACLASAPAWMEGSGAQLARGPAMPGLAALLVNPGAAVATAPVFAALGLAPGSATARRAVARPEALATMGDVVRFLASTGNDLERPAIARCPAIETVRRALQAQPGCLLARMSGSGATVFGLFETAQAAKQAGDRLARAHLDWWVQPATLNPAR